MASQRVQEKTARGIFQKSYSIIEKNNKGYYVLKHGKIQLFVGILCTVTGLGASIIPFIPGQFTGGKSELIGIVGIFGLFGLFGIYWTLFAINYQVQFNDEKIIVKNTFCVHKEFHWNEVATIEFKPKKNALFISTPNMKVKVLIALQGFYTIMKVISEQFNEAIYQDALIKVHQFYKKFKIY